MPCFALIFAIFTKVFFCHFFAVIFYCPYKFYMYVCCVQTKPLLIRVDTKSGHGAGKPTTKQVTVTSASYVSFTTVYMDNNKVTTIHPECSCMINHRYATYRAHHTGFAVAPLATGQATDFV